MRRSRLQTIVIDCNDLEVSSAFWAAALGTEVASEVVPPYRALKAMPGGLRILLQEVPEPKTAKSRIHLDIETGDVEAEVRRLEGLGASRQQQVQHWWVIDPSGNEFCVVPAAPESLRDDAATWETGGASAPVVSE